MTGEVTLRDLSILQIKRGDTLVVRSKYPLAMNQKREVHDQVKKALPRGTKILVLDAAMEIAVLRKDSG